MYYFCCDKTFVATKLCLSRQNLYVATNVCRNKHNFVATSILLSRQTRICRDKRRLLSRQKCACCDKTFVATNYFNGDKRFIATSIVYSRQRTCFVTTKDVFVATKMKPVAALAIGSPLCLLTSSGSAASAVLRDCTEN